MPEPSSLSPGDFDAYFDALWGYSPFPWQSDLLAQVAEARHWPGLIDLPTGTGKTSLIDIALFALALDAAQDPLDRWMPRRIVNIVDRRVVVDQTHERSAHIADRLADPRGPGVLQAVAARLRLLAQTSGGMGDAGADPPVLVAALRGGIVRDESWTRRPDVPTVLSSTIDQAGSRLLFRGYGVSRSMRPIHAGLLGNDALWLLDEVHLARPFAQTLRQVGDLRAWRRGGGHEVPDRWGVVEMSATPAQREGAKRPESWPESASCIDEAWTFPSTPLDPGSHPVIARRLRASKPARLVQVKVPGDLVKADEKFSAACAQGARSLLSDGPRTIGVIVNRVDTARRVHQALVGEGLDVVLLTGRMRPTERDEILNDRKRRLENGRARSAVETPLVIVATQCIEAGADFDLDGIVTEVASLDALRQRFGRVDRDGQLSEAGQEARSVILCRSTDLASGEDPVYGPALANTWTWLSDLEEIDFGILRLPAHEPRCESPTTDAPRLLPTHLDQLCQTSTPVSNDPEVGRWLHGDRLTAPDVHVIWRGDIDEQVLRQEAASPRAGATGASSLTDRLSVCPPMSSESLAVPIHAARAWLADSPTAAVSDIEGISLAEDETAGRGTRPWILWQDGRAKVIASDEDTRRHLRPGVTVIVPAGYGGLHAGSWDPTSRDEVSDLATESILRQRQVAVLRLHPALLPQAEGPPIQLVTAGQLDAATSMERQALVDSTLDHLIEALNAAAEPEAGATREVVAALRNARRGRRTIVLAPGRAWARDGTNETESVILSSPAPTKTRETFLTGPPPTTDAAEEASSFTGTSTLLPDHLKGVQNWAAWLGTNVGLDRAATVDLATAGLLHDRGKMDHRFQVMLRQGDEMAAAAGEPLAKSSGPQPSAARRQDIRRDSKYPRNARHELTSLPLSLEAMATAEDGELVAHLVASHHGWCRPFAPPVIDEHSVTVSWRDDDGEVTVASNHGLHRIDAGPPDRFAELTRRYGWFHLAWLESLLRLGDHRRSELEERDASREPTQS